MIVGVIAVVVTAAVIGLVIARRRNCPACHRRGLVVERHYKRARCIHCKAEFAHVDGGYVPIKPAVVPEAKP